jgi:hypothetical protein
VVTADLRFYDNDRPPLIAGDYRVTVTQRVELPAPYVSPPPYVHVQPLQVAGPHFGLGSDDVAAVYPPAGSTADRHATLAHVVLARPTLPWEIALDPNAPVPPDPHAADPLVAPWLAVLVLRPDEIVYPDDAAATGNLTGAHVVGLSGYLMPPAPMVGPSFTNDDVAVFEREYPDLQCAVVDVDGAAFAAIAPGADELPYLAHTREVDTVDQETDGATGWFGVVVGNRFPTGSPTGIYVAHLVSLEGFQNRLPTAHGPVVGPTVRLLSLACWTFNSFTGTDNFDARMEHLNVGVLRMPQAADEPVDGDSPAAIVGRALRSGYTAAPYRTRIGEETTAWYRGPCLPVQMERNRQPSYPAAEAALVYDTTTGMFDVSFAVAWQVGRLLALADRDFAVTLTGWLRALGCMTQLLADRLDFFARYDVLVTPTTVGELLAPGTVRRALQHTLATRVAPRITGPGVDGRGVLGPATDPTGLLDRRHRLPGVASGAEVATLQGAVAPGTAVVHAADGGTEAAILELVRARARALLVTGQGGDGD